MFEKQNGINNTFERWLSIYINISTPFSQYLKIIKKINREF